MQKLPRIADFRIVLLVLITGLVTPITDAAPFQTDGIEPTRTVVYKTTEQAELRLHLFEPEGHQATDARPAMVFFFGGGWNGGTPRQFYHQALHLAERGMVGISAEYRVKKEHGTSPFECVADALTAMRTVRQNAGELGIDPDRLGAGGGSAGGHLAIATSTVTADWLDTDPAELQAISPRPNALVLYNPVYDNSPEGYGHDRVGEKYVDFSPAHNLHADMPPTLTLLGSRDKLIPVATGEKVRDDMLALGVRSELIVYDGQPHGFFNMRSQKNRAMYDATTQAMDEFLVSLGWLVPLED